MKIGTYFTLSELTQTNTGLANIPNGEQINNLSLLVKNVLDPLREKYGKPITVTSGFRSFEVNKAVNKGKIKPSQHCKGEAADIKGYDNKLLFDLLSKMEFDQLIWEYGTDKAPAWVHVSFKNGKNRKQKLRKYENDSKYYPI